MKTPLLALIVAALCSCEINDYVASSSSAGNYVHEKNYQVGGTRSGRRSDGSSYANDYQKSLQDAVTAVVGVSGAIVTGGVNKAKNAATALTSQQLNASNAKTAQAKIAADAAAAKTAAQAAALKDNPAAVAPGATTLNAP